MLKTLAVKKTKTGATWCRPNKKVRFCWETGRHLESWNFDEDLLRENSSARQGQLKTLSPIKGLSNFGGVHFQVPRGQIVDGWSTYLLLGGTIVPSCKLTWPWSMFNRKYIFKGSPKVSGWQSWVIHCLGCKWGSQLASLWSLLGWLNRSRNSRYKRNLKPISRYSNANLRYVSLLVF